MGKESKVKVKLTIQWIFAIISSIIITSTMILTFAIIYVMLKFNFSPLTGAITSFSFIALLSIVVGTAISAYVSSKMLRPILKINDAAKKVTSGDYSVRLDENSIANEIREIAANFNVMVRELSNTETLASDFVSNVSHEFKTPLSAIDGYATLLQDDTISKEENEKYIQYILENTHKLTNLTQNILALSRLENQEIVLQKEHFLLDEQIRRVLLNYENRWEEKNLVIDLNLERIIFYGNQSLLAQVWSNLIDNAIKFSKQDGILSIDCISKESGVIITVRDNGIGMTDDVKKNAFEKFYQGEKSHSFKGNGLGLALVQRIVKLCGGSITIQSQKGKGTAVKVCLYPDGHLPPP